MFEDDHLSVPNLGQVHTVTVTHLLWSWCGLRKQKHSNCLDIMAIFIIVQITVNQNVTTLTILGSATPCTVLHNLLRSHLELSLM